MITENFYEILNCTKNSTLEDIKKNYQQLILKYHPDKQIKIIETDTEFKLEQTSAISSTQLLSSIENRGLINDNDNNEIFIKLNKAWNTLKDPNKRKLYDAELLQNQTINHCNIYAELRIDDFSKLNKLEDNLDNDDNEESTDDYDLKNDSYYLMYSCRCGGSYIIDETLKNNFNLTNADLLLECDECSLTVLVKHR